MSTPDTSSTPATAATWPVSLAAVAEFAERFERAVGAVVMGQRAAMRAIAIGVLARGHILLEGVPGTAKTMLAAAAARALGLSFRRIQFTPDLMPSDVVGTNVWDAPRAEFRLVRGPIFAELVLGDEINRAPPKTQAALLEAMQERQVTIDGTSHALPPVFTVLATQNPIEQEGTYPLPEAQLDRFLLKVPVGYPSADDESELLRRYAGDLRRAPEAVAGVAPISDGAQLLALTQAVEAVRATEAMIRYVRDLVRATRASPLIQFGAGPRAAVHLLTASRWQAALAGRAYVTPEDAREVFELVIAHRLVMTAEAELDGHTPAEALARIVGQVEVPR